MRKPKLSIDEQIGHMKNDKENGYGIIEELFNKYPYIKANVYREDNNSACSDLVIKYEDNFAIWNIVEVLSFGDFTKLYYIYYEKYKTKDSLENHLWSVRFIRNAAAHNNCLLNSLRILYSKKINPNKKVMNIISRVSEVSKESRQSKMKNPIIHDFIVSLYVFNNIVTSEGTKTHMSF